MYNYDDSNRFKEEYKLNPEIDSLYFHLLIFDLIITIYSFYDYEDYDCSFVKYFFESKETKYDNLML